VAFSFLFLLYLLLSSSATTSAFHRLKILQTVICLCDSRLWISSNILAPLLVSLQPVLLAISSPFLALFPAPCAHPTAEPARRDRLRVNVAAAFIVQPMMPTPLPAQVSFVCLFVYAQLSGRCVRGPSGVIYHWLNLWEQSHLVTDINPFFIMENLV